MGFVTKPKADKAYRNGQPIISDQEYDETFGENASDMDTPEELDKKIKHEKFMSSLHKIKIDDVTSQSGHSDFGAWWATLPKDAIIVSSWKYDGLAVELKYKGGHLVMASTRGDGQYGEDILANVRNMQNVNVGIRDFTGTIFAEIIITHEDFQIYLEETTDKKPYDNPRNGASGAARKSNSPNAKYCSLRYYSLDCGELISEVEIFEMLDNFYLDNVFYKLTVDSSEFEKFYTDMMVERDTLGFEVDGLVLCVNDYEHKQMLGHYSNMKPRYKIAVKFPHQSKETTLIDIEWQVGKTGRITPVGIIEEVDLGVKVNRATLSNINKMKEKRIMIGDPIVVSRRGDVIPHVEKNLASQVYGYMVDYPKKCPICNCETKIFGAFLMCENEFCAGRELGNLEKWIETMKKHFRIYCIGSKRLRELYNNGDVLDVSDLYRLNENDLLDSLTRVGEKSAKNMLTFQNYKKIPLHIFMGALNIPNVGSSIWKSFVENSYYKTIGQLLEISNFYQIFKQNVEGIGENRAEKMFCGIQAKKEVIENLIDLGIKTFIPEKAIVDSAITNKAFCITGSLSKGRGEFEGIIKKNGGIIKSSVSKKTDYLLAGENTGKTKIDKAEKCGTKVINETEFWELLNGK